MADASILQMMNTKNDGFIQGNRIQKAFISEGRIGNLRGSGSPIEAFGDDVIACSKGVRTIFMRFSCGSIP